MKTLCSLCVLAVLLMGCAQPMMIPGNDICPSLRSATALLTLQEHGSTLRLILRTETTTEGVTFVALDTVGAPLFVARGQAQAVSDWQLDVSKLYRGPAASELIEAYSWWQRRNAINPACAAAGGLGFVAGKDSTVLTREGKPWWRWSEAAAACYEYAGVSVQVHESRSGANQSRAVQGSLIDDQSSQQKAAP